MKKKELVRTVKQVQRLAELTTFDRVVKWYAEGGSYTLSEQDTIQKDRYERAFSIMCEAWSNEQTITELISLFKISRATACRDIREAKRLFGDINKASKEGERYLLAELAQRGAKKAWDLEDLDNYYKLLKLVAEIKGFDRDDAEAPDFSKMEQHVFVIVADATQIGLEKTPDINVLREKYKVKKRLQLIEEANVVQ